MHIIIFILLMALAAPGAFAGNAQKNIERQRTEWLNAKVPEGINPADLSPDQLEHFFFQKEKNVNRWFSAQGDTLLKSLLTAFVSAAVIALGGYVSGRLLRKKKEQPRHPLLREALAALNAPFFLGLGVTALFFSFYPVLASFERTVFLYDVRFFFTILAMVAAWAALNIVGVIDAHLRNFAQREDNNLDDLMVKVLRDIMRILVFATTILFIGQSIFKINITALLAGAGVIGLGAALAAKDTLSNFFGTIVILFDRPFKLCEVGMRSTKIIADDESVYTLPNSLLTTQPVRNINLKNHLKLMFDLGMTYDTTPEQMTRAIQLLHEIADNFHGTDRPGYSPRIFFSKLADSALNITVILWLKTESFAQEESWRTELFMEILKRFAEEKLNFAYRTQTLYLRTDSGSPKPDGNT